MSVSQQHSENSAVLSTSVTARSSLQEDSVSNLIRPSVINVTAVQIVAFGYLRQKKNSVIMMIIILHAKHHTTTSIRSRRPQNVREGGWQREKGHERERERSAINKQNHEKKTNVFSRVILSGWLY